MYSSSEINTVLFLYLILFILSITEFKYLLKKKNVIITNNKSPMIMKLSTERNFLFLRDFKNFDVTNNYFFVLEIKTLSPLFLFTTK